MQAPCQDCDQRWAECHASCEKYAEFLKEVKTIKKMKANEAVAADYEKEKSREFRDYRINRRRNGRR